MLLSFAYLAFSAVLRVLVRGPSSEFAPRLRRALLRLARAGPRMGWTSLEDA
jgi:hypothetical protein